MTVTRCLLLLSCLALALPCVQLATAADKSITLKSGRSVGDIDQVSVAIEASGERLGDLGKPKEKGAAPREKLPVAVNCHLDYHEKSLSLPGDKADDWFALRHYGRAEASLKVGDDERKPTLRPDRAYIAVRAAPVPTYFSPLGPLTLDEYDLLKQVGDSALLDALLPAGEVAAGKAWKPADELVAALVGLDQVTKNGIECVVKEITDTVVRFELTGKADGKLNDSAANAEIKGKYRFDLRLKRVDWIGLLVKVHFDTGSVQAEFDVAIRAQVRVVPGASSEALADGATRELTLKPEPALLQRELIAVDGDWRLVHDPDWYQVIYHRDVPAMRLVRNGEYIAHASITPLPKRPANQLPTLADFQADVKKAIEKSVLAEAGESVNEAKYRIFRVVANGEFDGSPRQWRYYHLTDPEGRQAVITFHVEERLVEKLGAEDKALVDGFRFVVEKKGDK